MRGSFSLLWRAVIVALGVAALTVRPSAQWVEASYANGGYPLWEHALFPLTNAVPWSLGDVAALIGIAAIVWRIVAAARKRRANAWQKIALAVRDALVIAAIYAVWFEASWGWNYNRAPIEARTSYDAARVNAQRSIRVSCRCRCGDTSAWIVIPLAPAATKSSK